MGFPARTLLTLLAIPLLFAEPPIDTNLPKPVNQAIDSISKDSLRGHLSFISSDLLEGRNTPSRGLDIAAEYIAAQFRRAGLEPIPGTDSYFQIANWKFKQTPADGLNLTFEGAGIKLELDSTHFSLGPGEARKADHLQVFKASMEDTANLKDLPEGKLSSMVVLTSLPGMASFRGLSPEQRTTKFREVNEFLTALNRLKPVVIVSVRDGEKGVGATGELINPIEPSRRGGRFPSPPAIYSATLVKALESLPSGETEAHVSLNIPAAVERPVQLKNVIGVLRGSDPELKDTYVMVTAHYDHLGTTIPENGDGVYNGANDDGSGTVSVIELASAFSSLKERPRRSIIFMTVFGEEKGLLGTRYYAANPVFPLDKTIADVNLEHLGRTDDNEGPQVNRLSITGFDYTTLPEVFVAAGKQTGVEVYKHPTNSDAFFGRSDNEAFAYKGIPAHTFCVAFEFPDYHGLGDHWDKIDYDNLTRINRTVATGLWVLSNSSDTPKWNESNSKTDRFRDGRKSEGNKTGQ